MEISGPMVSSSKFVKGLILQIYRLSRGPQREGWVWRFEHEGVPMKLALQAEDRCPDGRDWASCPDCQRGRHGRYKGRGPKGVKVG